MKITISPLIRNREPSGCVPEGSLFLMVYVFVDPVLCQISG